MTYFRIHAERQGAFSWSGVITTEFGTIYRFGPFWTRSGALRAAEKWCRETIFVKGDAIEVVR